MRKIKLPINKEIEKMRCSGIKFELISEDDAKNFLTHNTYYFKLKAFQKNYNKNANGEYINLDFAYLKDLSTIDWEFRKTVLPMVLAIEHSIKVKLNADISNDPNEDGYKLVDDFLNNSQLNKDQRITKELNSRSQSNYIGNLVKKYIPDQISQSQASSLTYDCPFWVLIELISFGNLIKFYNYYYSKHNLNNPLKEVLFPIQQLRNAVAHSNCILCSLKKSDHTSFKINKQVNSYVSKIKSISPNSRKNCLSVPALHDFAALLMVYTNIVDSQKLRQHTADSLENFVNRFEKNIDYYNSNSDIKKTYIFFKKLIDNFRNIVYNDIVVQKL